MNYSSNTAGVQRAAQQFCLRNELRISGAFMLVFGAFALLGGLVPPPNLALLCVGVVLFAAAVTNLAMPSPAGIVFSGLALVLVGGYNIATSVLDASHATSSAGAWPVVGVWQIVWGLQAFARYRQYPNQTGPDPTEAEQAQAREWVTALRKARPKENLDVIEITSQKNVFDPKRARVRLMPAQALVLINHGRDVRVVPSDQFSVQAPAANGKPGNVTVTMRAGALMLEGAISQEHLARYQQWKPAIAPPRAEPMARAA